MYNAMLRRAVVAGAMLALVLAPVVGGVAFAKGNKHQAEAVEHAKEAADHGKQGHADALVKHAEGALKHAEAAMAGNGLRVLEDGVMLKSEANLIVSKTADWSPDRKAVLDDLLARLED